MNAAVASLIAIVFLVVIMNFVFFYLRLKKTSTPYGRKGKQAIMEEEAAIKRDHEVQRRIDVEQDRFIRQIDLRGKTWALYDEVRKKHENDSEEINNTDISS